jgi:peptidoglycan/LPS O-acetylase OafA/YrhL
MFATEGDIMVASPASAVSRLPELDALRGIAALLVLVCHAVQLVPSVPTPDLLGLGWFRDALVQSTPLRVVEAGRPAVLFFFVLSGFVLTRALLAEPGTGIATYALQRSVRILPPAAFSVALALALRWATYDPSLDARMPEAHPYTWPLEPTPLRVTAEALLFRNEINLALWSLAHEWRLTVFFPLILLLRGRPMMLLALAFAVSALGLALGAGENEVVLPRDPLAGLAATLYFAPAAAAGAALALAGPAPVLTRERRRALSIGVVALFCMYSDLAAYAGSVVLIILAQQPEGRLRAALRQRWPVALGRISFSLYLVHMPVLLAAWNLLHGVAPDWIAPLAGFVAALIVAAATFKSVEQPCRRLASRIAKHSAGTPPQDLPTVIPHHRPG